MIRNNKPPCVLIVGDEERNRVLLQEMIRSFGYRVETASDGVEALAGLKRGADLVVLDSLVPSLDGFEVTRRIRDDAETAKVPVILVTCLESRKDRMQAVKAGANGFISKPVDRTEIRNLIEAVLKTTNRELVTTPGGLPRERLREAPT
jgi:CheY-like chemotaxis protein